MSRYIDADVRVGVPIKEAVIIEKTELTDECIDKIAEAVVQKLADRKIEQTDCDTCKWGEWYRKGYDITMMSDECGGCCSWNNKWKPKDEPQTDCGDFADRLAYERGVKHAWEVAQKVFDSTVTFYEAEDVVKQIAKTEPQTDLLVTEYPQDGEVYLIGKDKTEAAVMAYDVYKELTEPKPCEWCKFYDGEDCFSQEPCKVMLYFKTEQTERSE